MQREKLVTRGLEIDRLADHDGRHDLIGPAPFTHIIGLGTREEDALGNWPLTGRYRWDLA